VQVFICLWSMVHGFFLQVACFFDRGGQTQENEHAGSQLDSKEYRTSKAAFYPPVHSLRKNHAYNEFAKYCNPKD